MTPHTFLWNIIDPGLALLDTLGGPEPSDPARRFQLAIALQESGSDLRARYQNSPSVTPGPARGWWQFEQGGGVIGVLNHTASRELARRVCETLWVHGEPAAVWRALEGHDLLAAAFARLLIWTDLAPLPGDEATAWDYYLRCWRPGKPHPATWPANWRTADITVASRA